MKDCERVRTLYQSKDPNPKQPTHDKIVGEKIVDQKKEQFMETEKHWLCSARVYGGHKPSSPTLSNTGSKRSFQRDTERAQRFYGLRSSTTRRRKRVPVSSQSPTSNTRRHIRQKQCTAQRSIWLLLILHSIHNTTTDHRSASCTLNYPPLNNQQSWELCPVV